MDTTGVQFNTRHGREVGVVWTTRGRAHVFTRRMVDGELCDLQRGHLRAVHYDDECQLIVDKAGRMVWLAMDYEGFALPLVVGDYLDAEQALLDATTALDEEE